VGAESGAAGARCGSVPRYHPPVRSNSRSAKRPGLTLANGKSLADLILIARTLLTFHEAAHLPDQHSNAFTAYAHAKPSSETERDDFFAQFGKRERFLLTGLIASVRVTPWEEDVRVYIDRSNVASGWLFVNWTTSLAETRLSETVLGNLRLAIAESATIRGLVFAELS
jgi:hypothetical protein